MPESLQVNSIIYHSQLGQEQWVLKILDDLKEGYFIEVGAADGIKFSNTYTLEKDFKWNGICIEPSRQFINLKENRNCLCDNAVVFSSDGEEVTFIEDYKFGDENLFSGIAKTLDTHEADGEESRKKTTSLHTLLKKYNAPKRIDYVSIDTEGSELHILLNFPFKKWDIKLISVEHNNIDSKRESIFQLLSKNGFIRDLSVDSKWDDWYYHSSVLKEFPKSIYKSGNSALLTPTRLFKLNSENEVQKAQIEFQNKAIGKLSEDFKFLTKKNQIIESKIKNVKATKQLKETINDKSQSLNTDEFYEILNRLNLTEKKLYEYSFQVKSLQESLLEKETSNKSLERKYLSKETEVLNLKKLSYYEKAEIEKFKFHNQELENKNAELNQNLKSLNLRVSELGKSLNDKQNDFLQLKVNFDYLSKQNLQQKAQFENKINQLLEESAKSKLIINSNDKKIEDLTASLDLKDISISKLIKKIKQNNKVWNAKDKKRKKKFKYIKSELINKQNVNDKLLLDLDKLNTELINKQNVNDKLLLDLDFKNKNERELLLKNGNQEDELKHLRSNLIDLEKKLSKYKSKISDLKEESKFQKLSLEVIQKSESNLIGCLKDKNQLIEQQKENQVEVTNSLLQENDNIKKIYLEKLNKAYSESRKKNIMIKDISSKFRKTQNILKERSIKLQEDRIRINELQHKINELSRAKINLQSKLSDKSINLDKLNVTLSKYENILVEKEKTLKDVKNSYSWKLGHSVVRTISFFMPWRKN